MSAQLCLVRAVLRVTDGHLLAASSERARALASSYRVLVPFMRAHPCNLITFQKSPPPESPRIRFQHEFWRDTVYADEIDI